MAGSGDERRTGQGPDVVGREPEVEGDIVRHLGDAAGGVEEVHVDRVVAGTIRIDHEIDGVVPDRLGLRVDRADAGGSARGHLVDEHRGEAEDDDHADHLDANRRQEV